jgi:hypothetical protein
VDGILGAEKKARREEKPMLNWQILRVVLVVTLLAGAIGPFAAISFYVGSSPSAGEGITVYPTGPTYPLDPMLGSNVQTV